jgi:hypothetical protein
MMTTQRNNPLNRRTVPLSHLKINHLKEAYSYPEDEMSLLSPKVPGEQGRSNGEFNAIFRWEDDGGRTN